LTISTGQLSPVQKLVLAYDREVCSALGFGIAVAVGSAIEGSELAVGPTSSIAPSPSAAQPNFQVLSLALASLKIIQTLSRLLDD
jgi:hypothetical protein